MRQLLFALMLLLVAALPALAVRPDEIMKDPVLEARARSLSAELRCMICQSQSIDESDSDIARDLRVLIRERLSAGDSDAAVKAFLVSRYGEFVLLKPAFSWHTALLWGAPPLALAVGGVLAFLTVRRRRSVDPMTLSPEEEARVEALLAGDPAFLPSPPLWGRAGEGEPRLGRTPVDEGAPGG